MVTVTVWGHGQWFGPLFEQLEVRSGRPAPASGRAATTGSARSLRRHLDHMTNDLSPPAAPVPAGVIMIIPDPSASGGPGHSVGGGPWERPGRVLVDDRRCGGIANSRAGGVAARPSPPPESRGGGGGCGGVAHPSRRFDIHT
jgi:hypothetical protein